MSDSSYIISFSEMTTTAKTIKRQKVFPFIKSKSHNQYKSHFDLSSYTNPPLRLLQLYIVFEFNCN